MRAPEFEAMIAPARLYPELWRLLLGILLVAFIYIGFIALLFLGLFVLGGPFNIGVWLARLNQLNDPVTVVALLLTAVGFLVATLIVAPACHRRGPGTLFGPRDETLRGFTLAILVCVPFYAVMFALGMSFGPAPVPNIPLETWLLWLPAAVPLILLQVSGEEVLFRGYLPQQLAARFRPRFVWMVLPAIAFGLLHYNPAAGDVVWMIVLSTFLIGLIAMDLTERTGSLGAAIGLHFVNNLSAVLLLSQKDSLSGLALWVSPVGFDDTQFNAIGLGLNVLFLLFIWRAIIWAVDR